MNRNQLDKLGNSINYDYNHRTIAAKISDFFNMGNSIEKAQNIPRRRRVSGATEFRRAKRGGRRSPPLGWKFSIPPSEARRRKIPATGLEVLRAEARDVPTASSPSVMEAGGARASAA